MSSEYFRQTRPASFLSKKPKRIVMFALIILLASLSTSVLPALLRSGFPGVHPVAAATNALGVVCAYGASSTPFPTPTPITTKDGDITTLNPSCEWVGDIDGDGALDPLVSDNPSLASPGSGGGFIADIVVTGLNTLINGFDITLDYNTTVLNAVTIDQSGLLFGGNVGCSSCTLTTALSIDQTLGEVRLSQAILGVTAGPGGSCNVMINPGCTSPNQELFRIWFDVVGTGRGFINFSTDPTKNVITNPGPVAHSSQNSVLGTDALFNLLNGQTTGAFNASWTLPPNFTPGSAVTFTAANAICTYCTAPFTYNWDFSSQDAPTYVAKVDATGKTATVTPPPPVINRVTLTVTDSAAHSVSATRRLPLKAVATAPTTAVQSAAVGPFTSKWLGGVVTTSGGYSGLWKFCPGTAISHPVCSSGPIIVSQAPGSITQTNSVPSVSWNFAGFYNDFFTISDTAVSQISATPNTVVVPVPVNVTGATPAYTVSVNPDKTTINAGQSVSFTVAVTYNANYPPASKSTGFNYAFDFGDGGTDKITGGGLSVTDTHIFNTGGSFIVRVTPRETSASAPSQIQENGYSPTITVIPPLAADFTFSPTNPTSGQTVTFTSTVTGGNTPYTFAWDFGDSTMSALANPTHAFTATTMTTFTVKLTVTDSTTPTAQTKTVMHDVVVGPAAFDFTLGTPSPSSLTVTQGTTSASSSITATLSAGTTAPVTFSASGLPTGVTAGFTNSRCNPTCTVMVSFTATATATLGPATVSIDASGGGQMHSTTLSLTVQAPTQVPAVTVNTPTPNPANTGATVTITFTVTSTVTVTGITVDWGDGTAADSLPGTATSDMHLYASTGASTSHIFTITVTATNSAGPGSGHTTEVVNDRPPTATVTNVSPNPANTGQMVTVAFTTADPDGTVSSISVNWGDGTAVDTLPGTATTDIHTYSNAGPFTITVTATDNSGSTGQGTGSITVNIPVGVPTVTVNAPTPKPADTGATVTVTFTVTSTVTVTGITVDWGDGTTADSLLGTAVSDNHIYTSTGNLKTQTFTITVTATNSAGLGSGTTSETVNDRPPTATVTNVSPNPADTGQLVTLTFSTADPDGTVSSISVNWGDGTALDTLAGTATSDTHAYQIAGPFTITVTATDNSGSTGQGTGSITVRVPVGVPTVTVNAPTPNPADTSATVTITFTVASTAPVTGITVDWGDGTAVDSLSGTATSDNHVYASTGNSMSHVFTITVTATNSAGPGSGQTMETVNDRAPVVAVSNVSPNPADTGQMVTVTFTATDPDGTVSSISVDWGDGTAADTLAGTATSAMHPYTHGGSFTITVTATDNSGSTGHNTGSITVNVPVGAPTVTVNSPTPNPADTGATVTVTFAVTSSVTITGITVDWGDGTTPDALSGTATSDIHLYASTGNVKSQTFTITVTATNSAGPGSGTTMETINDRAPVASFTFSPNSPSSGQTVNFDASASADPDGTITSYAWDFGDGTTGTGVTTTHSYSPIATTAFTVMLTVTDNSGNTGSTSQSITVTVTIAPPIVTISNIAPNPATTGQTVTVTFTVSSTAPVTGITVDWGDGTTPDALSGIATTDPHIYTTASSFSVTVTATNSAGPGSATAHETVTAVTGNRILLTFKGFDIDDCDNNVGQLNVLVNNNLVVNLPPCPQPTGDNLDFMNKFVSFGPFDITSFVTQGENTLVFMSPPPGHFGLIFNVTIRQGDTILLHVNGPRFVNGSHPVTLTFSNPPLTVTSFTVGPTPVTEGVQVTFTATFTGGTGPFTCMFTFGDGSPAIVVTTSSGTCSATHNYDNDDVFFARVKITGQATSDVVRVPLQVNVQEAVVDP